MKNIRVLSRIIALALPLAACQNQKPAEPLQPRRVTAPNEPAIQSEAPNPVLNGWQGKWTGPEGTFLELSRDGNKFVVKINSLDGPMLYEGTAKGDHIEFQRNGITESIHAGNGEATGMKWLLDKQNCLVIKKGEGFCRSAGF